MMELYKTTLVIWTDYDPQNLELSDLAREAEVGDAYCASQQTVLVNDPESDENAPACEFFETVDWMK